MFCNFNDTKNLWFMPCFARAVTSAHFDLLNFCCYCRLGYCRVRWFQVYKVLEVIVYYERFCCNFSLNIWVLTSWWKLLHISKYKEVPTSWVHPRCAKAHNYFGPTLGGDVTLKWVLLYAAGLCLAQYCNAWILALPCLMDPSAGVWQWPRMHIFHTWHIPRNFHWWHFVIRLENMKLVFGQTERT